MKTKDFCQKCVLLLVPEKDGSGIGFSRDPKVRNEIAENLVDLPSGSLTITVGISLIVSTYISGFRSFIYFVKTYFFVIINT